LRPPECTDTVLANNVTQALITWAAHCPKKGGIFLSAKPSSEKGFPKLWVYVPQLLLAQLSSAQLISYNKVSVLFFEVSNHQMLK
jgi:hypothetical protein